jgi:hypothetical protein
MCLFIRKFQKALTATVLFLRSYYMVYLQSLCTRPFGIAEHVKLGHIQTLNKFISLLKVFIRFTPRTHYDIHTDKSVGHHFFHSLHFGSEEFRIIPTAHQF